MVPYAIRRLQDSEAERMARFGGALFVATFGHLYSPKNLNLFLDQVHSANGVLADLHSGRVFWIAESPQGEWLGYCKCGPVGVPVELDGTPSRELKQLYVEAPYHGRGVSHRLIEHYFDWARSEGAVDHYVSCWSENHRALRFYAKYGFEVVGSYTFYVGDHQDDERILKSTGYRSISEGFDAH